MAGHVRPFAFWGRVSTEDRQDPESSRGWQITRAKALVEPAGGRIVAEFFDIDKSRSIPPQRRPQAHALLRSLADAHRGFDAVVVGEPQRAFYGNQFGNTFPLFSHYGVQLWVPEVGGPIDPGNEAHDLIMSVFGGVSKAERNRIRIRVRTAMAAQAQREGRFLGGRPPYGYALADVGPHPNPLKAADGKRLHTLTIDEPAAAVVRRIFAEFLAGHSTYAIAVQLTADGIPCPSAHDRQRNPHRSGQAWSKGAVRAILLNPRYTGLQVWNRQRKDEVLIDVTDITLGHTTRQRWNDPSRWIYSSKPAHTPIIDTATFHRAQQVLARKDTRPAVRKQRPTAHRYLLLGVMYCGKCGRKMHGSWNNNQPYYRCRHTTSPEPAGRPGHLGNVCVQEAAIMSALDAWLAQISDPGWVPCPAAIAGRNNPDHNDKPRHQAERRRPSRITVRAARSPVDDDKITAIEAVITSAREARTRAPSTPCAPPGIRLVYNPQTRTVTIDLAAGKAAEQAGQRSADGAAL